MESNKCGNILLVTDAPKYQLTIGNKLHFICFEEQPNLFHRVLQSLFFGFKWGRYETE